jgi:hypothetical protein
MGWLHTNALSLAARGGVAQWTWFLRHGAETGKGGQARAIPWSRMGWTLELSQDSAQHDWAENGNSR